MRIISGIYKSRKLLAPKGDITRPTSDRARESLFNVLNNLIDFDDISVLDLFAGSGAFAFEALSRGAAKATLVEQNRKVIETIRENAQALEIGPQIQIVQKDVYTWLGQFPHSPTIDERRSPIDHIDLIFADPPYDDPKTLSTLPAAIFGSGLLTAGSLVIAEHRRGSHLGIPENAELFRELSAGEAVFSFLRQKPKT